ncbi:hypothetical protein SBA4_1110003 [Candidatus Sulfopaludibacter sp. SbA4]|nr:hypothetical protein SBA4_1110003 [Candidatus Sulfopaludibacter sp. SbA4]
MMLGALGARPRTRLLAAESNAAYAGRVFWYFTGGMRYTRSRSTGRSRR